MSYIVAEKLAKKYGSGEAAVKALRDVSFQIETGEFVGLMGESGAIAFHNGGHEHSELRHPCG